MTAVVALCGFLVRYLFHVCKCISVCFPGQQLNLQGVFHLLCTNNNEATMNALMSISRLTINHNRWAGWFLRQAALALPAALRRSPAPSAPTATRRGRPTSRRAASCARRTPSRTSRRPQSASRAAPARGPPRGSPPATATERTARSSSRTSRASASRAITSSTRAAACRRRTAHRIVCLAKVPRGEWGSNSPGARYTLISLHSPKSLCGNRCRRHFSAVTPISKIPTN